MKIVAGEVAFVTGAASGIGLAMCHALARAGLKIAMADIDANTVREAASTVVAAGGVALSLQLDVADLDAWVHAVDEAEAALGPVQLLCNNAGISALGVHVADMAPSLWAQALNINLTGVFNGAHTLAARMRSRGAGGHIVNTASVAALGIASAGGGAYAASKYGVLGLSEVLRQELAPHGIGVTALCPGPVKSQLWRTSRKLRGLPDLDQPPPESMRGSASPDALDPAVLADWLMVAIERNDAYLATSPELRNRVAARNEAVLHAFDLASAEPIGTAAT